MASSRQPRAPYPAPTAHLPRFQLPVPHWPRPGSRTGRCPGCSVTVTWEGTGSLVGIQASPNAGFQVAQESEVQGQE